ncbi:MAG: radical SAM protein [bacterium]
MMGFCRIGFAVTTRCNLNCIHCMRRQTDTPVDLSPELMEKVLRQSREAYGVKVSALTGGEPLLHPRIQDIFQLLADLDFTFSFVTNGQMLKKKLDLLKNPSIRKHLSHVAVSIEGTRPESNDFIRGRGTFKKAMEAIMALKTEGIPVFVKYTIGRHNLETLEQDILEISHLGVSTLEMSPMLPTPENMEADIMPRPEECRKSEAIVQRMAGELKMQVQMATGKYIPQAFYTCFSLAMMDWYVDAGGRLCVCCMLPGVRGQDEQRPEPDVIADLSRTDLWDAHRRLVDVIAGLQRKRIEKIASGELNYLDHFQCIACMKHFGKLEWLKDFPDSPWCEALGPTEVYKQ